MTNGLDIPVLTIKGIGSPDGENIFANSPGDMQIIMNYVPMDAAGKLLKAEWDGRPVRVYIQTDSCAGEAMFRIDSATVDGQKESCTLQLSEVRK